MVQVSLATAAASMKYNETTHMGRPFQVLLYQNSKVVCPQVTGRLGGPQPELIRSHRFGSHRFGLLWARCRWMWRGKATRKSTVRQPPPRLRMPPKRRVCKKAQAKFIKNSRNGCPIHVCKIPRLGSIQEEYGRFAQDQIRVESCQYLQSLTSLDNCVQLTTHARHVREGLPWPKNVSRTHASNCAGLEHSRHIDHDDD